MGAQFTGITPNRFYPSELFLGKEPWKFEATLDPGASPMLKNWVEENLKMQEMASKRLAHLRDVSNKRANRFRLRSSYQKGEYVLVHKSRFPQRKIPKIESPWLGPYQIVEVRHNVVKVFVSPNLGGMVEVSLDQIKRWCQLIDFADDPADQEGEMELDDQEATQEVSTETLDDGFYNVQAILKHKFHQGWRFLTHWEGFPISASTWEPKRSFILPDGRVCTPFLEYCRNNGLMSILKLNPAQE
jgi:hypothetical protein